MRKEDLKLTITKDKESGTYCAFPKLEGISGLIVQTDSIEEIPKEIAKSLEVLLKMSIDKQNFEYSEV